MKARWLFALLVLTCGSALAQDTAREAGWHPLSVLWGSTANAIAELHTLGRISDAAMHHRKIDKATQGFLDGVLQDLADFDLGKMVQRLPHEFQDGYRELWVRGALRGTDYVVEQPGAPPTPTSERGAVTMVLRGKRLWTVNERKAFSAGGHGSLGVGELRWERVIAAGEDVARLFAAGTPAISEQAKKAVQAAHPALKEEDVALLGIAFDAFPELARFLSRFGKVEDVRTVWSDRGYQQLTLALRGLPAAYAKDFPLTAKYAKELTDLIRARVRWVDAQGRTLVSGALDSKELTASIRCYLKDGKLLPFRGGEVFEGQPVDMLGDALARTKLLATLDLKLFGLTIKVSEAELDATYTQQAGRASFAASFTKVPPVEFGGKAFGFMPPDMVETFMPGTMKGLAHDFLHTAASAHKGRGATAMLHVGATKKGSTIEGEGEAVVLDNALIRMGMALVNDRLLPSPALFAELERLAGAAHAAFMNDLASYEASH